MMQLLSSRAGLENRTNRFVKRRMKRDNCDPRCVALHREIGSQF
jgi:hypothetical protein